MERPDNTVFLQGACLLNFDRDTDEAVAICAFYHSDVIADEIADDFGWNISEYHYVNGWDGLDGKLRQLTGRGLEQFS